MPQWPHQNDVDDFYGNPRGADGGPDAAWEQTNIRRVAVPWRLVTAWDGQPVSRIRVHRLCEGSLGNVLNAIWAAAGAQQSVIDSWGMNLFAGAYNYRPMRGSSRLSMHSWGCAVDFDSDRNAFGSANPHFAQCPHVLNAFSGEGWVWGGNWNKPDGMHWQAAMV